MGHWVLLVWATGLPSSPPGVQFARTDQEGLSERGALPGTAAEPGPVHKHTCVYTLLGNPSTQRNGGRDAGPPCGHGLGLKWGLCPTPEALLRQTGWGGVGKGLPSAHPPPPSAA